MNEHQLKVVKIYEYDEINNNEIDSLINKSFRDCNSKYFKDFKNICEYDLNFTNIAINEIVNFKISDSYLRMDDFDEKIELARVRGYEFNHINKLKIKFYTTLNQNNIHRHLKFQCPILVRQILKIKSRNPESIQRFCNIFHNLELVIV